MSGKTDPQIVREYLSDMGIGKTPELVEAVLRHVERELAALAASLDEIEMQGWTHSGRYVGAAAADDDGMDFRIRPEERNEQSLNVPE